LACARRERPSHGGAADQRDEIAAFHSAPKNIPYTHLSLEAFTGCAHVDV
jgi:hypothetical protein